MFLHFHLHPMKYLSKSFTAYQTRLGRRAGAVGAKTAGAEHANDLLCLQNHFTMHNNPRAHVTTGEAAQPETKHFIGVALAIDITPSCEQAQKQCQNSVGGTSITIAQPRPQATPSFFQCYMRKTGGPGIKSLMTHITTRNATQFETQTALQAFIFLWSLQ